MTEPLVDARELLRGLHNHKVEYVLFGALAMIFYGYVRTTEDLDVVVAPDQDNLNRVAEWLMSIDAVLKLNPRRRFGPRERGDAQGVQRDRAHLTWPNRRRPATPGPTRLVGAGRGGRGVRNRGQTVTVMNRSTLIELKRRRGSHLDLADIEAIERLAEL